MDPRPTPEEIKQRALAMMDETLAFPEEARPRLMDIKRGALEGLVAKPAENARLMETHYPGWTVDDLKTLLGYMPKSKPPERWGL